MDELEFKTNLNQVEAVLQLISDYVKQFKGDLSGMYAIKITDRKIDHVLKIEKKVSENLVLCTMLEYQSLDPMYSKLMHIETFSIKDSYVLLDTEERFNEIYKDYLENRFLKYPDLFSPN